MFVVNLVISVNQVFFGDSGESCGSGDSINYSGDIDKSVILANMVVSVILVNLRNIVMMKDCQDHILTENMWFVWSKTSYSGDKRRFHQEGRTTRNDDKQGKIVLLSLWAVGRLNFAIAFTCCFVLSQHLLKI